MFNSVKIFQRCNGAARSVQRCARAASMSINWQCGVVGGQHNADKGDKAIALRRVATRPLEANRRTYSRSYGPLMRSEHRSRMCASSVREQHYWEQNLPDRRESVRKQRMKTMKDLETERIKALNIRRAKENSRRSFVEEDDEENVYDMSSLMPMPKRPLTLVQRSRVPDRSRVPERSTVPDRSGVAERSSVHEDSKAAGYVVEEFENDEEASICLQSKEMHLAPESKAIEEALQSMKPPDFASLKEAEMVQQAAENEEDFDVEPQSAAEVSFEDNDAQTEKVENISQLFGQEVQCAVPIMEPLVEPLEQPTYNLTAAEWGRYQEDKAAKALLQNQELEDQDLLVSPTEDATEQLEENESIETQYAVTNFSESGNDGDSIYDEHFAEDQAVPSDDISTKALDAASNSSADMDQQLHSDQEDMAELQESDADQMEFPPLVVNDATQVRTERQTAGADVQEALQDVTSEEDAQHPESMQEDNPDFKNEDIPAEELETTATTYEGSNENFKDGIQMVEIAGKELSMRLRQLVEDKERYMDTLQWAIEKFAPFGEPEEKTLLQFSYPNQVNVIFLAEMWNFLGLQRETAALAKLYGVRQTSVLDAFNSAACLDAHISSYRPPHTVDMLEAIQKDAEQAGAFAMQVTHAHRGLIRFKCHPLQLCEMTEALKRRGYTPLSTDFNFAAKQWVQLRKAEWTAYKRFLKEMLNLRGITGSYDNVNHENHKKTEIWV